MKIEINPQDTLRGEAFELWMSSPMPMVTLTKTFDVTKVVKVSKKLCVGFNALLCWCIVKAASQMELFYLLPEQGKLFKYDSLAINVIVKNRKGGINSCDIPFNDDLAQFNRDYMLLTQQVSKSCTDHDLSQESMIIGTSALAQYEIDGAVGMYSGIFNNPFMIWGKYKHHWLKTTLTISFQFHHVQMDGAHAAKFLNNLQTEINNLR